MKWIAFAALVALLAVSLAVPAFAAGGKEAGAAASAPISRGCRPRRFSGNPLPS